MMKPLFIFLLFISLQLNAQNRSSVDSLFMVKNYLIEIQEYVNTKKSNDQKLAQLDKLAKAAAKQNNIFERKLKVILDNKKESDDMKVSFKFILQSMALYKSDFSNGKDGFSEKKYLRQNIPPLIDKILYHCKRFEDKIKFNTP